MSTASLQVYIMQIHTKLKAAVENCRKYLHPVYYCTKVQGIIKKLVFIFVLHWKIKCLLSQRMSIKIFNKIPHAKGMCGRLYVNKIFYISMICLLPGYLYVYTYSRFKEIIFCTGIYYANQYSMYDNYNTNKDN